MDKLTSEKRSWNMSRIRGSNTKPEIIVRKFLYANGFKYRVHSKLIGKPDIVFFKIKTVVFVHGCFWHSHGCKKSTLPKTNKAFWTTKLNNNVVRDIKVQEELKKLGWKVITIWECELHPTLINKSLFKIRRKLLNSNNK